jgi:DNA-binding MarR family transcriptional regulator
METTSKGKPAPLGTMLGLVIETIKVLNAEADRNDMGTQTVLTFLTIASSGSGGIPQSQLLKLTGMTQAGVSRNITRLGDGSVREAGLKLIESYEDPMNRRYKLVKLTAKGKAVVDQIYQQGSRYCTEKSA